MLLPNVNGLCQVPVNTVDDSGDVTVFLVGFTFKATLHLVLALNRVYCPQSADTTTEVPGSSVTEPSFVTESENMQRTTAESCLKTKVVESFASTSKSSYTSSDVSVLSTTDNSKRRTISMSEQTGKSLFTSDQSKTVSTFRHTKYLTTTYLPRTTGDTETSAETSSSVPNNISNKDNTVLADNIKQSTPALTAGNKTNTKFTATSDKTFMKTTPTSAMGLHAGVTSKSKSTRELIDLLLNITAPNCHESECDRFVDSTKNCYCDELCYFYNDCCYSMMEKLLQTKDNETPHLAYVLHEKVREIENKTVMLRKDLTECVGNVYNKSAFIMVNGCDKNIKTSADIYEKCELSEEWYNIYNIPVDHIVNDKAVATFKNVYCALCNGISENETVFWNIDITCTVENIEKVAQMELKEIAMMEECVLRPYSMFTDTLRQCMKDKRSSETCDKTDDTEMADLCKAYIYPLTDVHVIDTARTSSHIYKNPHCVACASGKLNLSNFYCHEIYADDDKRGPEDLVGPVNLKVIFDFSLDKGIVSKVKCVPPKPCKTYEIYDCASKRCRQLYCQTGETPFEGKCVETFETVGGTAVIDTLKPTNKFKNLTNREETFILELLSNDDVNLLLYALRTTGERIITIIYELIEQYMNIKIMKIDQMRECFCLRIRISAELDIITDLFPKLVLVFEELENKENRGYSLIPMFIKIKNFQELNSLECSTGTLITERNPSIVKANSTATFAGNSSIAFALPSSAITAYEQNCIWEIGYNKETGVLPTLVATCFISDDIPNLNCPMIAYGFHEVEISNTSMKIINTSLIFDEDDFIIFKNQVFICADKTTRTEGFVNVFTFSDHHRILSLVTSLVSAVSAAVVMVTHCCSKRLRNIHGLNLSALSVSTMLMHVLLIVQSAIVSRTTCLVYSIVLHFVLLNIFVWMNVIGYDMARIFIRDKIVSQSSPFKRFLGYFFLSLVIPSLIIAVAASLDFTDSAFKPNYGDKDVCWLSNGKSIIMFVIGPVVTSLLLNFCFFTFTVKAIYSKAKQTKFARNRSYFVVYLKLTLILGLTWIVGILGAFVKQEWLWIVHLVLNGLQGLSLLICSVVNVRNIRHLRASLKSATVGSNSKWSNSTATENNNL